MQANQHLLLQPWILAKRIGSILISGNNLDMTPRVSWRVMDASHSPGPGSPGGAATAAAAVPGVMMQRV